MELQEGLLVLFQAAKGRRHKHYKRVVEKAEKYMALATGEGMDRLLKKFARRESDELFKQRVEITTHITQCVVGNIQAIYNKLPRSRYTRNLYHTGARSAEQGADLDFIASNFWGKKSLDDWFAIRYMELNEVDPNAWCVIEFEETDGREYARPYPFEACSAHAVDFMYRNHILEYLTIRHEVQIVENNNLVNRQKLTLYIANQTVILQPIPKAGVARKKEGEVHVQQGNEAAVKKIVWLDELPYELVEPIPHNLGGVSAFVIGHIRDLYTGGETYVSNFERAIPFLEKSLKINSEADLTKSLAAFPLTLRYADPCESPGCQGGYLSEGSRCETCHGTGVKRPTSVQEELVFSLPKRATPDDIIDLDKLWIWKSPPVEMLRYQDEVVDALTRRAVEIVFNSDMYSKQEVASTATGKRLDLENTYDTLYTMGIDYAQKWTFSILTIAKITELDIGLVALMRFPRDFKLKSVDELLAEYQAATTSGAGPEVRQAIEENMVQTLLIDDPVEVVRYEVKSMFNPFRGMTENEIGIALNSSYTPTRYKVQYLNLGSIFDEIEQEQSDANRNFYEMPYRMQKELISAKVLLLTEESQISAPIILNRI